MIRREDEPYPGTVLSAHQPYHLPPVCGYCADVKEGYPLIPARESPRVPPCINTVYHGRRRECRSSHTNDPRMPKPRHSRHHPFLFCGARGERWPSPAGARGITHAIQVTFFLQDEPAREREILWLCKAIAAYFLKKRPHQYQIRTGEDVIDGEHSASCPHMNGCKRWFRGQGYRRTRHRRIQMRLTEPVMDRPLGLPEEFTVPKYPEPPEFGFVGVEV